MPIANDSTRCATLKQRVLALSDQEFGLDVVLRVGQLRYREHRCRAEIHQQLLRGGVTLGERSVSNLLTHNDTFLSLSSEALSERAAKFAAQERVYVNAFEWLHRHLREPTQ